jgi:hypothetical protein
MQFMGKIVVCFEDHMSHKNTFCGQNEGLSFLKQVVHTEQLGFTELNFSPVFFYRI